MVRNGVRHLHDFLALDPRFLPNTPQAVKTEIRQLQSQTAARIEAAIDPKSAGQLTDGQSPNSRALISPEVVAQWRVRTSSVEAAVEARQLALAHVNQGSWDEAVAAWREALSLYGQLDDLQGQTEALAGLAVASSYRYEWDDAIDAYLTAQRYCRQTGDSETLAILQETWGAAIRATQEEFPISPEAAVDLLLHEFMMQPVSPGKPADILGPMSSDVMEQLQAVTNPVERMIAAQALHPRIGARERETTNPVCIPPWSILRATLLDLLCADEQTRDTVWAEATELKLSGLELDEADWRPLRAAGLSGEDAFSSILCLTVEYLLRLPIGNNAFVAVVELLSRLLSHHGPDGCDWRLQAADVAVVQPDEVADVRELRLDTFEIPPATLERMRNTGVLTWGDVTSVSERRSLAQTDMRLGSFLQVHDVWWLRSYVRRAARIVAPLQIGADDGFAEMVRALVGSVSRRPEDETVLLGRMGLLEGRLWTLQELGERLKLTRERVRQIEQKLRKRLEAPRHRKHLDTTRHIVSQVLRTSGGICTYEELGTGLRDILQWKQAPSIQALERFILSFDICECKREEELASHAFHECLKCPVPHAALGVLLAQQNLEMPIGDVAAALAGECAAAAECGSPDDVPKFSHGYVRFLLYDANHRYVDDNTVYSRDLWQLRYGSRVSFVESILRAAGKPMHFTEVLEDALRQRPGDDAITARSVHSWLDRAESVLLWDRGTFIYEEAVSVPQSLLTRIERWLIEKLGNDAPFVMVSGAFTRHQDQCVAQGVTSETALYTCLRRSGNPHLVYPRYPQAYLAESYESRVPALVALEQYIRDAGREVSMAALTEYALHDLCLKEFQFQQCIGQMSGILRTGQGGFLDISLVSVDADRLERLKNDLLTMVCREGHIAVTRVFEEKRVTCRMLGIGSPEMLYSLLRERDFDELDLDAYPKISMANRKRRPGQGRGVIGEVVAYIRQKAAPVSFEELEDRYVDDLGYNERVVHTAALAEGVLRYGQGSVVHTEAVGWSDEKQTLLERVALAELASRRERGWIHGLASDMLDRGGLPDLSVHVAWTQTLVCELLTLGKRFRVLGNARNAFVPIPNGEGIQSLDDFVAKLLSLEFGGASDLEPFEDRLRELGVIKRRLTASMLGEASQVVATEHLVVLRELSDRAK